MVASHSSVDALRPPGSNTDARTYLKRLLRMRSYAWASARRGVESENSSAALGQLWLLLEPGITIFILWLVFDLILDISRGTENFVAFLTVGIVVFRHNHRGIIRGASAISNSGSKLLSFSFPRAVLVVSQVLHVSIGQIYSVAVMFIVLPLMGVGVRIGWLWILPLSLLQLLFSFGMGLLLARPATRFTDFRLLLEYVFTLLFYASGVFFPLSAVVSDWNSADLVLRLAAVNPLYSFVELGRAAMMGASIGNPTWVISSVIVWSFGSLVLGFAVFRGGEESYSGVRTVRLDARKRS